MSDRDRDAIKARLDELSVRLEARMREFKDQGEFSDVHQALMAEIRQRHDRIKEKLAAAEAGLVSWDIIETETKRDFDSIFDDLLQRLEQLDSEEMKRDN